MDLPLDQWGRRLSDALRRALREGDYAGAERLAREGDGQARNLAKEFTFMVRGLDLTIQILLRLLGEMVKNRDEQADSAAVDELTKLVHRFRKDLARCSNQEGEPRPSLAEELTGAMEELQTCRRQFEQNQAELADQIIDAIARRDGARALELLDVKEISGYVPLHDCLVRFMADSFAWVLRYFGDDELIRFHLATAEGQRVGFEKWESMSPAEFAWTSAFLLKQHMGQVTVSEDEEKFTIAQAPCGSGGRLRRDGAYRGAGALPFVTTPGPLTFGQSRLPIYCSHCAIWNGTAPLRWFGHPQWVFEDPARSDGGCTLHIYKRPENYPRSYRALVALSQGGKGYSRMADESRPTTESQSFSGAFSCRNASGPV